MLSVNVPGRTPYAVLEPKFKWPRGKIVSMKSLSAEQEGCRGPVCGFRELAQAISVATPRTTSSIPATVAIRIAIRRPSRRNEALKRSTRLGVASGCSK